MAHGPDRWRPGDVILRREVLNDGRVWLEYPVIVVLDEQDLLATYLVEQTPFRFPEGEWPSLDGRHPWHANDHWDGHGVLMLQRPEEMYAVWVFWQGRHRRFDGWYLNLQAPFRRRDTGYDTQDLELDILVDIDGAWTLKDDDVLEDRVEEGRFTASQVTAIRQEGRRITDMLDAGERWWSDEWSTWMPDPSWKTPTFDRPSADG